MPPSASSTPAVYWLSYLVSSGHLKVHIYKVQLTVFPSSFLLSSPAPAPALLCLEPFSSLGHYHLLC